MKYAESGKSGETVGVKRNLFEEMSNECKIRVRCSSAFFMNHVT